MSETPRQPIGGQFDLLTVGHSNHPIDRFTALLQSAAVAAVIDVRSQPTSRRYPWFSANRLREHLERNGIAYLPMGHALGGRPRDAALFRDGVADYEAMASTAEFAAGIEQVIATAARLRSCLMCAEREPLDCHRCLLVAPALAARVFASGIFLPMAASWRMKRSRIVSWRCLGATTCSARAPSASPKRIAAAPGPWHSAQDRDRQLHLRNRSHFACSANQGRKLMQRTRTRIWGALIVLGLALAGVGDACAQDKGTLNPQPLPPLANPDDPAVAAKELFGRRPNPAPLQARAIGFYSKGCLAGASALPINGKTWQVMRLSRNRNWGHPNLIRFLERFADKGAKVGWPGLLVGDLSQARGGPMLTGHASHQVGLDADIWLTPMPDQLLTREEREEMSATNVVRPDKKDIDPAVWTPGHVAIIRAAAKEPEVERIFVNAAIKKALCRDAAQDRSWLYKVRPMWGHNYHFHIRMRCPGDNADCKPQEPPAHSEGCGHDLDWWFTDAVLHPKPPLPAKPKPLKMADLPAACRQVLVAP